MKKTVRYLLILFLKEDYIKPLVLETSQTSLEDVQKIK